MPAPPPRPPSGVGLGANVLVGGLDKSIALQPLSVEGNKGLNVAAGIGSISLQVRAVTRWPATPLKRNSLRQSAAGAFLNPSATR